MTIAALILALQMMFGGNVTPAQLQNGISNAQQTGIIVVGDTLEGN